jgi:hypothetical protein
MKTVHRIKVVFDTAGVFFCIQIVDYVSILCEFAVDDPAAFNSSGIAGIFFRKFLSHSGAAQ